MIKWLRSRLARRTSNGPLPLLEPVQLAARSSQAKVEELQAEVERLLHLVELANTRSDHARSAHAAIHRRVNDLKRDWPAVHTRYFTAAGIADRLAGVPMNPRKNRKR